jgi:hypothetical protein
MPTMTTTKRADELRGSQQTRELPIQIRASDDDARTMELAFASEMPVERWWGAEILDHSPGAVRLGRANDGAALLLQHDRDQHIGVVESARVDNDRVARAVVRFSRSAARRGRSTRMCATASAVSSPWATAFTSCASRVRERRTRDLSNH